MIDTHQEGDGRMREPLDIVDGQATMSKRPRLGIELDIALRWSPLGVTLHRRFDLPEKT
ncbi:hypothetical protein [Burkholderia orbicola]|uniref:hypothetical protein n=1 Tax=Burkholderia orbicola TaxID=2978683 RepID=UPI00264CBE67|nr:hypothetical protein [Burkholderia orbicola]MDN7561939.1 hypothetical protein [Burkholderia orbicola]